MKRRIRVPWTPNGRDGYVDSCPRSRVKALRRGLYGVRRLVGVSCIVETDGWMDLGRVPGWRGPNRHGVGVMGPVDVDDRSMEGGAGDCRGQCIKRLFAFIGVLSLIVVMV